MPVLGRRKPATRATSLSQADPTLSSAPLDILHRVFGYSAFRGHQAEIVDHLVGGGDALVLMPTGGGKSLCYQIPALLRPGVEIGRAHV